MNGVGGFFLFIGRGFFVRASMEAMEKNRTVSLGKGGETALDDKIAAMISTDPVPGDRDVDIGMKALFDRTGQSGVFQGTAIRMVGWQRYGDGDFQFTDATGIGIHVFAYFYRHAFNRKSFSFGDDTHDGTHTTGKGGSDEISWGEAFSLAMIVEGGIRVNLCSGRFVNRRTPKVVFIACNCFDHVTILYPPRACATLKRLSKVVILLKTVHEIIF